MFVGKKVVKLVGQKWSSWLVKSGQVDWYKVVKLVVKSGQVGRSKVVKLIGQKWSS